MRVEDRWREEKEGRKEGTSSRDWLFNSIYRWDFHTFVRARVTSDFDSGSCPKGTAIIIVRSECDQSITTRRLRFGLMPSGE